jgi:hypothetical protein
MPPFGSVLVRAGSSSLAVSWHRDGLESSYQVGVRPSGSQTWSSLAASCTGVVCRAAVGGLARATYWVRITDPSATSYAALPVRLPTPHAVSGAISSPVRFTRGQAILVGVRATDLTAKAVSAAMKVQLWAHPAGATRFTVIAAAVTDGRGTASIRVRPSVTTTYRWSLLAGGGRGGAWSPVRTATRS